MKNSIHHVCQLIIIVALLCIRNNAHAVGAVTPFTSYEAESGLLGGGATIIYLTNAPTTAYSSPQLEASGHAYVQLTGTGQYVQWTNNTGNNITAINLRSCIPDAPTGGGIVSTIDMYVNGTFRQNFSVNSQQNYNYEGTNYNGQTDKNPADGDPRNFWNDTHAFVTGASIAPGSTIRFQKDSGNTASFYDIDVVDLEAPPAALGQPANSLSIVSYGAVANSNSFDNTAAINSCFAAAQSQGKIAWIPPGTYFISSGSGLLNATGITIAGAGPWYSTIYRATTSGYVGNIIQAASCTLSNVLLDCNGFSRDAGNNNGAVNFAGTNWVVNNVWIQHVTSAFWCAGVGGVVENCRVLSVWSDGGNFNQYQSGNGIGMNLTYSNNFVRGTGDDAMAINATEGSGYTPMNNIKYVNNTSVDAYGGKGMAVYGGYNLTITNNLITDSARYDGIEIGFFSQSASISNALVQGNVLLRCGGNGYGDMSAAFEAGDQYTNHYDYGIIASGNIIINPLYGGLGVTDCSGFVFNGNNITAWPAGGNFGIGIWSGAIGNALITNNTVNGLSPSQAFINNSSPSSFTATVVGNSWQSSSGQLIDPVISAFSSYYNSAPYVRNVTNLVQNNFVTGEPGLSGPGYATDTHDNGEDDVWHRASGDNNPYVIFDLGTNYNLFITRIWNLNQAGSTQNGAKNVRISISGDGTTYTIIGTNTLAQGTGTTNEPAQDFSTPTSVVRYVKLEPLDGYGGGWNGLGAVRFVVNPVTPTIYAFSSYYNSAPYVRNVTNLVQNYFVPGEVGLSGPGFSTDTHDNNQDDVWHRDSSDSSPYVIFDLGGTCNLSITRIWNLNQSGNTLNGAKDVRVSVSTDGTTFTVLGTATLNQAGGTPTEPSQNFATPATGIRYVKLEPLDGYGGGWNGLSAVRFQ